MKSNEALQKEIQDALNWQPELYANDIGVTVIDGFVTLAGVVNNYAKKEIAEKVARNVIGVKVVAENLKVKINTWTDPSDEVIEKHILNVFKWQWDIPEDKIQLKVDNGWVTLEGKVQWQYQKEAAYRAVSLIIGVKGINNCIGILNQTITQINKSDILSALSRSTYTHREAIKVETGGNRVILTGSVNSFYQKEEAGKIAWSVPGVEQVDNQLVIEINRNDNKS